MKNIGLIILVSVLCIGCKTDAKKKAHRSHQSIKSNEIKIDTIISTFPKIVGQLDYCKLVESKEFEKISPSSYHIPNVDSLSYGFKIGKDTLLLSYKFANNNRITDRNVILSGKNLNQKRLFIKDSTKFSFTGFMSDYRNAKFYIRENFILIKSQPSDWTGLMNQYEFYQLLDTTDSIVYEFFVNEYAGCK